MNSCSHMHDGFRDSVLSEPAFVLGHSEDLGRTNIVFDLDSVGGDGAVELLPVFIQLAATRFLEGHKSMPVSFIALISRVLHDIRLLRKEVEVIRNGLVMGLSAYGGTDEKYRSQKGGDYTVFKGMPLLLPAICLTLPIIVLRSGNLPFGAVVDQYRKIIIAHSLIKEGKILLGTCRRGSKLRQGLCEKTVKSVYPQVAVTLLNIEMVCHQLLCRVILQIVQNEVKSVLDTGQRTVPIYRGLTDSLPGFPSKLMVTEIPVMYIAEIWKKNVKVLDIHTSQCPEHCFIVSVLLIAHNTITMNTCVRAYACNIKNLNYNFSNIRGMLQQINKDLQTVLDNEQYIITHLKIYNKKTFPFDEEYPLSIKTDAIKLLNNIEKSLLPYIDELKNGILMAKYSNGEIRNTEITNDVITDILPALRIFCFKRFNKSLLPINIYKYI